MEWGETVLHRPDAEIVFAVGLFFISAYVFVCSFGTRVSVHVMSCTVSCHWF